MRATDSDVEGAYAPVRGPGAGSNADAGDGDGRVQLPSGTVTFLFTDIEGSTSLFGKLGSSFRALLDQHNAGSNPVVRSKSFQVTGGGLA